MAECVGQRAGGRRKRATAAELRWLGLCRDHLIDCRSTRTFRLRMSVYNYYLLFCPGLSPIARVRVCRGVLHSLALAPLNLCFAHSPIPPSQTMPRKNQNPILPRSTLDPYHPPGLHATHARTPVALDTRPRVTNPPQLAPRRAGCWPPTPRSAISTTAGRQEIEA